MKSDWIDTVRWCHRAEDPEFNESLVRTLLEHCDRSRYSQPIFAVSRKAQGVRAEGYMILYPGALASLGNLSVETSNHDSFVERDDGRWLLIDMVKEMTQHAFAQGAELVQAISPLLVSKDTESNGPAFISPDPRRDEVLMSCGLRPIAKLVQMEAIGLATVPKLVVPQSALACGQLHFVSHRNVAVERWHELIENTYVETLDVPELNGLRQIESTLAGYASSSDGVPDCWWVVQCKGVDIGCLLITRNANHCCELTYVGLKPQWRAKGLSKPIMNFVRDWAIECGIQGITLAVDLRNTPAIRLYQSCGFMTQGFVQAWILSPKCLTA